MSQETKRFKSYIWTYFKLSSNEANAICLLCNAKISRGGIGKTATASAMVNHLRNKHYNEFIEYDQQVEKQRKSKEEFKEKLEESKSKSIQKQLTLKETISLKKKFDINSSNAMKIHRAIGEMIAIDNEPISTVHNEGFRRLLACLEPRYEIPSRKFFIVNILPTIYEELKEKIQNAISAKKLLKISFTTDIWTCSHNNESFISWTAHWINEDFKFVDALLNVTHFPGSHTGERIGELLNSLLKKWKLEKNNVHLVISDNAANMVKGITKDGGFTSASCFIHTLQLVINNALISQRSVTDMLSVSRKIVGHFKHSSLACLKLKTIQEDLGLPRKKLHQDVITRWNSTFYMLESLLEQKRAITVYCSENNLNNLTSNQWTLLEATINLLRPFEEITKQLSKDKSLVTEVIPLVTILQSFLKKDEVTFFGVGTLKSQLLSDLDSRFTDLYKTNLYLVSTTLDPRFKTKFFAEEKCLEIKSLLYEESSQLSNQLTVQAASDVSANQEQTTSSLPASATSEKQSSATSGKQSSSSSVWDCFQEIIAQKSGDNEVSETGDAERLDLEMNNEIDSYLRAPVINKDSDPVKWWRENKQLYPNLSSLARIYLSAPGTSVYSERVFSEAGNVYTDKRSRLSPDHAELLIFLHHNLLKFA